VIAEPNAQFATEGAAACGEEAVSFRNRSTSANDWQWNFGDGATSSEWEPEHAYSAPGTYTVSLTASNPCGSNTETKVNYLTISGGPTAGFTASTVSGTVPLSVTFTDESTSATGIVEWNWSFGDGGNANLQHPTHVFTSPGVYTVMLSVADRCGEDTATLTITVLDDGEECEIDFYAEPNHGCEGVTVMFQGYPVGECTVSGWSWDFGDPASGTSNTALGVGAQHTYAVSGSYTVTLTALGAEGALQKIKTNFITVQSAPTAAFTASPSAGPAPLFVHFDDRSTGADDLVWHFGDPASGAADTSYEDTPYHMYESPGTYTVTLIAANECGSDTATTIVTVSPVVTLVKEVDKPIVVPGERLEYTLRLRNLADYTLYYVQVSDTIPDSGNYVAGSLTAGGTYEASLDVIN
jgi:uncharacterized repeat protein (TIGR01451 family)